MAHPNARIEAPASGRPRAPRGEASGANTQGTLSARMVVRLVQLLERRGVDPRSACEAAGLSIEALRRRDGRVAFAAADRLLEGCAQRVGAGDLSLSLLDVVDDDTYDAAGLVLLSSPNLATGLRRAFAYQRLWGDGERFALSFDEDAPTGTLRFRHPGPSPLARGVLAELAFLETMRAVRGLVEPNAKATRVHFAHSLREGTPVEALEAALGARPQFDGARNELVLSRALLVAPLRVPAELVGHALEALARRALEALPSPTSLRARLRALSEESPQLFGLGVAQIAGRLRMSARTLQRRLGDEGTSWKRIVDEARRERDAALSARGASAKEITFLLGFADTSALTRARARWRARK